MAFYRSFGQYDYSMEMKKKEYVLKVYNNAIESGKPLELAEAYYLLSKYENGIGNYHVGKNWLKKALVIHKSGKYTYEYGRIYQRLCENEMLMNNFTISKKYADSALMVFEKCNSVKGIISTYRVVFTNENIFNLQDSIKNKLPEEKYQFKLKKIDELISLAKNNDLEVELGYQYELKGVLQCLVDPKAAIESFIIAKNYFQKFGQDANLETLEMDFAIAYAKNGETKLAWELLNKPTMFKKENIGFNAYTTARQMALLEVYKADKNWQKAFESLEKLKKMDENNFAANQEKFSKYYNSLTDHDQVALNHNKDYELKLQSENVKTNAQLKNLMIAISIILSCFLAYLFWQYKKIKKISNQNFTLSQKNELLLKEQNHRILNNLQVISSIIGLQKLKQTDRVFVESMDDLKNRIQVMGSLQENFYGINAESPLNAKDFLEDTVNKLKKLFDKNVTYNIDIESINIKADAALHLGIIVNELITNSHKYAFEKEEKPEIKMLCHIKNNQFILHYTDNGKIFSDLIKNKNNESFGHKLIGLKVQELNGQQNFNFENGFSFNFKTNITNILA
jgi:two-component system, sensor histidine kinase PdtaS